MEEQTFLNEQGVTVTNARYIFSIKGQPQTAALSGITAVTTQKVDAKWPLVIILALIGLVAFFSGSVLGGLVFLGSAGALFFLWKAKHIVVTTSASGASKGYQSTDPIFVGRVVEALNNAIISRG